MPSEEHLSPVERELEAALSGLRPAQARIDRDALQFRAGQASVRRRCHVWQSTTVLLGAVVAAALVWPPTGREIERVVYVPVQPSQPEALVKAGPITLPRQMESGGVEAKYVSLRNRILEHGLEAWPQPTEIAAAGVESPLDLDDGFELPARYRMGGQRWGRHRATHSGG